MKISEIEGFRKHLRTIERSVVEQLKVQTSCCGVTLTQCHTLVELGDAGTINLAGLSERMGLDASTLSRTIDSMFKVGLITREIDASNRRAVVISLTKKGEEKLGSINRSCNEFYAKILKSIPEKKIPLLMEGVSLVATVLVAENSRRQECL